MTNEIQGMAGAIPRHPLNETLSVEVYICTVTNFVIPERQPLYSLSHKISLTEELLPGDLVDGLGVWYGGHQIRLSR